MPLTMRLVDAPIPRGPIGTADPSRRRSLLRDRLRRFDRPPGTTLTPYGLPAGAHAVDHPAGIAVQERAARLCRVRSGARPDEGPRP